MRLGWMAGFLAIVTPFGVTAQVSDVSTNGDTTDVATDDSVAVVQYDVDPFAAVVPWGPGERLEYQVKLGIFSAGDAYMAVIGVDSIRGEPSYHVQLALRCAIVDEPDPTSFALRLSSRPPSDLSESPSSRNDISGFRVFG